MNRFLTALSLFIFVHAASHAGPQEEAQVGAWLTQNKGNSIALRQFAQSLPKGADLHSHLSGATYAEDYLRWGAEAGYCVDIKQDKFLRPPCMQNADVKLLSNITEQEYSVLVKRMSTKDYIYNLTPAHDQFFHSFDVFNVFSGSVALLPKMLAQATNRAGEQKVLHVELMITLQYPAAKQLAEKLAQTGIEDFAERAAWLKKNGMVALVQAAIADLTSVEQAYKKIQQCDSTKRAAGCDVEHRWLQQVVRGGTPTEVFTQIMLAYELFKTDKAIVGLNLVGPEDGVRALRDYRLHMEMLRYFSEQYPAGNIALHAGELNIGLVPPERLKNHITEAITIAGAKRIGHGVSIGYEESALNTLALMRDRGVLVEICLTSNALILGVEGTAHPLRTYIEQNVPVALATDDEGVSRIDLSNEYQRAISQHNLSYAEIKKMSRDSLTYSFLSGASIWSDATATRMVDACEPDRKAEQLTSASCKKLLAGSTKAARQWLLETRFTAFENGTAFRTTQRWPNSKSAQ